MDVSVQYVDPVKKNSRIVNGWGLIWNNCEQGSSTVGSLAAELGSALEDALVLLSSPAAPLEMSETCCLEKEKMGENLIVDSNESFPVTSQRGLVEDAVIPCSRNMYFSDAPYSVKEKMSNAAFDVQSLSEHGYANSSSVMHLPFPLKAVSALKGSHEK